MCDTDPQSNRRKPNNYVEVDNTDCVRMTQSFDTYDIHRVLCSQEPCQNAPSCGHLCAYAERGVSVWEGVHQEGAGGYGDFEPSSADAPRPQYVPDGSLIVDAEPPVAWWLLRLRPR